MRAKPQRGFAAVEVALDHLLDNGPEVAILPFKLLSWSVGDPSK
jgi:hypothetical protein